MLPSEAESCLLALRRIDSLALDLVPMADHTTTPDQSVLLLILAVPTPECSLVDPTDFRNRDHHLPDTLRLEAILQFHLLDLTTVQEAPPDRNQLYRRSRNTHRRAKSERRVFQLPACNRDLPRCLIKTRECLEFRAWAQDIQYQVLALDLQQHRQLGPVELARHRQDLSDLNMEAQHIAPCQRRLPGPPKGPQRDQLHLKTWGSPKENKMATA